MRTTIPYLFLLALLVAACSSGGNVNGSNTSQTVDNPAWTQFALVNARTGETFTLADFAGRTVFVEPMATWCSNCRNQQQVVAATLPNLDSEQYVFISLSVGEFIEDQDLAIYADNYGFPWIFAIATEELAQALVAEFGYSVQSPPSTPHFTISPTGVVSALSTGHHSQEAIISEVVTVNNS